MNKSLNIFCLLLTLPYCGCNDGNNSTVGATFAPLLTQRNLESAFVGLTSFSFNIRGTLYNGIFESNISGNIITVS